MTDQENTSILRSTVNFHQGITLRFRAWSLQTREEIFFHSFLMEKEAKNDHQERFLCQILPCPQL